MFKIPLSGRNPGFTSITRRKPKLLLLNKIDLADPAKLHESIELLKASGERYIIPVDCRKQHCSNVRTVSCVVRMYVHMYVCTYVHMYVRTYVRMYICTYVRTYLCAYVHMYICTYVHMYLCTYVRMYLCTYVCMTLYLCCCIDYCYVNTVETRYEEISYN